MLRAWLDMPQPYPISRGLRLYYDDLRSAYGENLPPLDTGYDGPRLSLGR